MKKLIVCSALALSFAACSTDRTGTAKVTKGTDGSASTSGDDLGTDTGGDDFATTNDNPDDGTTTTHDPTTCAEATSAKSYIGCDYWPTVTGNAVWSVFDYAVVVSNPGSSTANVMITGGALGSAKTQTVAPGALVEIGLPWVTSLKGADADGDGSSTAMSNSVKAVGGAYHLVSDVPVLVYQFNALEYKAGASGNDLNGTSWSSCPADTGAGIACNSYSNDASLLLPSTAMTPNYIVTGLPGDDIRSKKTGGTTSASGSSYAVITGITANTTVTIQLSKTADILASSDGTTIAAVAQNTTTPAKVTYTIGAGDVLELLSSPGSGHDLTGSIIEASSPIQLLVGNPCTTNPTDYLVSSGGQKYPAYSCDHVEASVLPIETWGKAYVVTSPTGPDGGKPTHTVRIYGGSTAAALTYSPSVSGAPATIAAGAVVAFDTTTDFSVTGDHEFAVSGEMESAQLVDPTVTDATMQRGDPSLTFFVAVEQYRDKYLFLAPNDYSVSYVDIVVPMGATLTLDGAALTTTPTPIGTSYGVIREPLTAGMSGAHTLTGTMPFAIQVIGYGVATSYQYPGGLDLKVISQPPPPIQ